MRGAHVAALEALFSSILIRKGAEPRNDRKPGQQGGESTSLVSEGMKRHESKSLEEITRLFHR